MPAPTASKEKTQSPVERLAASINELVDHPTSKGAHFYRTSLRRFQAWSAVARLDSKQQRSLKLLEKLRKATGKLRDSEVHIDLLDKVEGAGGREKKKVEKVLRAQRKSAKQKLSTLLDRGDLKKTLRALRLMGEPPVAKPSAGDHPLISADQLALDEYRAFVQNRAPLSPENLHAYR
ncbi:MAG TPA: CHAD domain-containing protein, partial [Terriglobales bacterium]|nr:CHAD domain-containing protein [Terriglobales bacterium]